MFAASIQGEGVLAKSKSQSGLGKMQAWFPTREAICGCGFHVPDLTFHWPLWVGAGPTPLRTVSYIGAQSTESCQPGIYLLIFIHPSIHLFIYCLFVYFYCCSSTVVSVFPPPLSTTTTTCPATSRPQSYCLWLCSWVLCTWSMVTLLTDISNFRDMN